METLKIIFVSGVYGVISRPEQGHAGQNLQHYREIVYALWHKKHHHG